MNEFFTQSALVLFTFYISRFSLGFFFRHFLRFSFRVLKEIVIFCFFRDVVDNIMTLRHTDM